MMSKASKSQPDFTSLHSIEGLRDLDQSFLAQVKKNDRSLLERLLEYRDETYSGSALDTSNLILALAPILDQQLSTYFGIEHESGLIASDIQDSKTIAAFKKDFILKRTRRYKKEISQSFDNLDSWLDQQLTADNTLNDRELAVSLYAQNISTQPDQYTNEIEKLTQWCVLALRQKPESLRSWTSLIIPQPVDPVQLVRFKDFEQDKAGRYEAPDSQLRERDGFSLTDPRMERRETLDHIHYCVYCHKQEGDFCSRGFPEKKKQPELGLKVNALGVDLTGCPLEEKISEMHVLKRDGFNLAALAVAMIDNPMIPATGHRICNDCMKACIYQKQEPVNIPQIETRVLTDVLDFPWGVEIYDLLTRWNPLRRQQNIIQASNGKKVLIVGMGPAGFTMAHHLTMEGCSVVGIDGLKIEPLPDELLSTPIRDYQSLCESLDERVLAGFGGVAEYGITVRWDKNFLKLIYLTLARRANFQVYGGVRFGGTVTVEDAWALGFHHVCIANGAGLPRVIDMGNSLARGMRQANDFLMALQLTGAAKQDSLANLQLRLPALVIGGGLTAIDTATEAQAYYIKQVEKITHRYEQLVSARDKKSVTHYLDKENKQILEEMVRHGHAVRKEREQAAKEDRQPNFIPLLRDWGGVTVVYRKKINESPAYLRNHEEIIKAMEEGIYYAEGFDPIRAELDEYGHVSALTCRKLVKRSGRWLASGVETTIPARAILVAAGTFPNTIYESEHPGTFKVENNHFLPNVCHQDTPNKHGVQPVKVAENCKSDEFGPFTSYQNGPHRVSFIGDAHPVFNGNVVKAIASALRSYPDVISALAQFRSKKDSAKQLDDFKDHISDQLSASVVSVNTDHPAFIEMWVRAPMAAKNFKPGQFYRLQTYETHGKLINNTRIQIPLQTISGAGVDGDNVRLCFLRYGANAKVAEQLKPGDPLVLMGPTGTANQIDTGKTILVIAGSWGAAVMLALGPALRAAGNRILYLATYPHRDHLYHQGELEQSADQIIWATASDELILARRSQDVSIQEANAIRLIQRYHSGELTQNTDKLTELSEVDEVLVMGGTGLLKAMQDAFKGEFKGVFKDEVDINGTVGSPMQCMLKGVCGQCLQWQIDPDSGQRTRAVFSCSMQDQPLMWIDIDNLAARQTQNFLQDHLTNLWVDHVLASDS